MNIITNNVPRQLIYGYELSPDEKHEFDYIADIEEHDFFRYRGFVYDPSEFMSAGRIDELKGWDGYSSDSYFSGTVIRYPDGASDEVIVGRYCT